MIEIEAAYSDANLRAAISRWDDDGGASQTPQATTVVKKQKILANRAGARRSRGEFLMPLIGLAVDDGPHNMDGLLLHASDGSQKIEAFISRRVMDSWVDPVEPHGRRRSLFRAQYNALGKLNLAAIERIVVSKYQRGAAHNRQHPFVDVLLSDITESEEALDTSELVREPAPPAFQRMPHLPAERC